MAPVSMYQSLNQLRKEESFWESVSLLIEEEQCQFPIHDDRFLGFVLRNRRFSDSTGCFKILNQWIDGQNQRPKGESFFKLLSEYLTYSDREQLLSMADCVCSYDVERFFGSDEVIWAFHDCMWYFLTGLMETDEGAWLRTWETLLDDK